MRRGFERRTALMTMAMLAGTSLTTGVQAQDGSVTRVEDTPALAQSPQAVAFDIPAQPLASALTAFGRQSGYQVSVDQATLANLNSAPVSGAMAPEEALRRLLSGTGLAWRSGGGRSVFITKAADGQQGAMQLDPLQVQGFAVPSQAMIDNLPPPYAGGQVATGGQLGLLGNRDVMDTPFNQTNYTAKKAQDQQAKTIRDVLIDDPSARPMYRDGSAGADGVMIRGFSVFPSSATYGGVYGILPLQTIMSEIAERVEVLKGPSAMLNGMSPGSVIGGNINVVPKRATDEPLTQATASYASSAQFGIHADIARRFGEEKQFGVRFNTVYRNGETATAGNTDQRALAILGLDYRGERVRLSADLGYQYQFIGGMIPYLAVANGVPLPWAPDAKKNYGQPWNQLERKDLFGVVRGEVDITEQLTAYATFGAHDYRNRSFTGGSNVMVTALNGNGTSTPNNNSNYWTYLTAEAGFRGRVETGAIGHEFAFSLTTLSEQTGNVNVLGTAYATNIYNPTIIAPPNLATGVANKTATQNLSSLAFADTLTSANKRVQLTAGFRLQQVQAANFNVTTGAQTASYDQSAFSPSLALVLKPLENVSIYGNWIQGLQQGSTVGPTFTNAGEVFPPFKATQYEVGVKVDWGKFTTTANVFQISQPSIITNTANNTQVLGGEQVNQGLEFNFFGEPTPGIRLLGGAMFLNAVLTKTQGGLTDGWTAPMSPNVQLNLGVEWDTPFVRGLTLTGRGIYTGAQYIDATFPRRSLAEWTRFDIGARYVLEGTSLPTGKPAVLRFAIDNVLDANYYQGGFGATTLNLGMPRTFRVALTADF